MLQERIEGKWLAAFRRVLALNGIGQGTQIAILSETQSRPVLVHLCELAAYDLGASSFHIQMPTPAQSAPVPVNPTRCSSDPATAPPVVTPAPAAAIISAIKDGKFDIISVMPNFLLLNDAGNRLTAR